MFDKFSSKLQHIILSAHLIATAQKRKMIEPIDMFNALAQATGSLGREILMRLGVKVEPVFFKQSFDKINQQQIKFTDKSKKILEQTVSVAANFDHKYIGSEHLLHAFLNDNDQQTQKLLHDKKIDLDKANEQLTTIFSGQNIFDDNGELFEFDLTKLEKILNKAEFNHNQSNSSNLAKTTTVSSFKSKKTGAKTTALDVFARQLTDPKVAERIDPVIGRAKEINRVIQVLSRRTKNNPVLLGDAGVGKTAIVEGLAKRILAGDVPDILLGKKIYSLDMNFLIAGSVMRGEFEGRLKQVIEAATDDPNIILFIDEIHTIAGAGAITGTLDAANILKPALARGDIHCIGATTYEDYKKNIEDDSALDRRFQPINVPEPTIAETIQILQGLKERYQDHHQVNIDNSAIIAASELSARYIPERFLPDKAIDLIDEACSRLRIDKGISQQQRQINFLEDKLASIIEHKGQLTAEQQYDQAIRLKDEEIKIMQQIMQLEKTDMSKQKIIGTVTATHVIQVLSDTKDIPLNELSTAQSRDLISLEKRLKKYIVGQDKILFDVATFIKRARAGFSPENRPFGSFMFVGPSGVGKTETAKVLAREVFGSVAKLIRFDMSEFAESFSLSRMIGSPPGYIGFKEGGKLTEAVKRNPYSLVLFDEVEKAHPQILSLLLQILEEGELTDATGKKINFKNTIIILTTNLGLVEQGGGLGFSHDNLNQISPLKQKFEKTLKQKFNPELLNRLDQIFIFEPLTDSSLVKIVKRDLKLLEQKMLKKNINLSCSQSLISFVSQQASSSKTGARTIRQLISQLIESQLADKILMNDLKSGDKISATAENQKIVFKQLT